MNGLPAYAMRAFEYLEIAGEEAQRYEDVSSALWGALLPSDDFDGLDPRVYRSHVQELLVRASAGRRLDTYTDAEVLVGLHQASLIAPLRQSGLVLFHHLFRAVIGEDAAAALLDGDDPPRPMYPRQILDELSFARARISPHTRPKHAGIPRRKKAPRLLEDA